MTRVADNGESGRSDESGREWQKGARVARVAESRDRNLDRASGRGGGDGGAVTKLGNKKH